MKNIFFAICILLLALSSCDNPATTSSFLLAETDLASYEHNLDHATLMEDWNEEFYHKGMITYREACFSCHGNLEQPGTLPDSRQFWKEPFKNGADPYSMYQTLTRGYGLMPPQVRLTPREKYEVIHYIREEFIRDQNPDQFFEITDSWLASLPAGDTLGPDPEPYQPWAEMDYGNFFIHTYDLSNSDDPPRGISRDCCPIPDEDFREVNFSYKGIAIRLDEGPGGVASGNAFVLFDHDLLRLSGFWTGEGFIDYQDILLNDRHNIFPRTVGEIQFENPVAPGWANPETGTFEDPRFVAVDGRPFGPLPREWAHYKGLYYHEGRVVIRYAIADAIVLESYDLEQESPAILSRTLNITAPSTKLKLRIAPSSVSVAVTGNHSPVYDANGFHTLEIDPGAPAAIKIWMSTGQALDSNQLASQDDADTDLSRFTLGGPAQYAETLTSPIIPSDDEGAYVVDVFALPQENPWKSRMRPTGIDFLEDGDTAVVSTIDGEVYRVEGLTQTSGELTWHRIATGLYQPLGIKYHNGAIYVGCRDQIVVLRDLNGDGETDYYESFNSDHQVTEHFHEFAMGLQTDEAGNFYYAKSGRHARKSLVPQHGTLIRVSSDGQTSEILANGFRAANGVLLNPDGSFIVTDQEGFWNPMNRINWVEEGGFYGNMWGYGAPSDSSDQAMEQPLMWVDQKHDRSPAELLWADSDRWGPLQGNLLSFSYGYGKIFSIMPQFMEDGTRQAGMIELPVPQFPTGIMRGRFNPVNGQLYVLGMSAWATNQMIQVGGMYRVRYTGKPLHFPVSMEAVSEGIQITFASALDKNAAESKTNYTIQTWDLKRTSDYGSDRYNIQELDIDNISLSDDQKTVLIRMPDIKPTWIMEISYALESNEGTSIEGVIQNTIYDLEKSPS